MKSDGNGEGTPNGGSSGRALVVHPALKVRPADESGARTPEARLDEAVGLARAIQLEIVHQEVVRVPRWRPATLLGAGVVETLGRLVAEREIAVAVIDAAVSPVQQRNLERAWKC